MPRNPFDSLPTLASSPPGSPRSSRRSGIKSCARRLERCCCQTLAYFPLSFIYGLTTWAVWVAVHVCYQGKFGVEKSTPYGNLKAFGAVGLYLLANSSYTIAVFTSPGSPLDPRRDWSQPKPTTNKRRNSGANSTAYQGLPTHEDDGDHDALPAMTTVTAKSSGAPRFCTKCQCVKPDRTHHCSSCGRCVLKMDHHCPWLATCVGLRNYKAFFLFLLYTSMFCWLCFAISASWVWNEIMEDDTAMEQGLYVINTIMLAVLGGIIGLVLSGFTAWHAYLVASGQTTIESLEKTRYLSPLKKSLETPATQRQERHYGEIAPFATEQNDEDQSLTDRMKTIHANAIPGVLRREEGITPPLGRTPSPHNPASSNPAVSSPARSSLQQSYASLEAQREHQRYSSYLDEVASEKLPHAFGLGWQRNLILVMGRKPLLWGLPVCNSIGDGWAWEVSDEWLEARERVGRERADEERHRLAGGGRIFDGGDNGLPRPNFRWTPGQGFVNRTGAAPPSFQPPPSIVNAGEVQMQSLTRPAPAGPGHHPSDSADSYSSESSSTSSDPDARRMYAHAHAEVNGVGQMNISNWNDLPDEMLGANHKGKIPSRSGSGRGRRKGD